MKPLFLNSPQPPRRPAPSARPGVGLVAVLVAGGQSGLAYSIQRTPVAAGVVVFPEHRLAANQAASAAVPTHNPCRQAHVAEAGIEHPVVRPVA
jgi:hypothetical protein